MNHKLIHIVGDNTNNGGILRPYHFFTQSNGEQSYIGTYDGENEWGYITGTIDFDDVSFITKSKSSTKNMGITSSNYKLSYGSKNRISAVKMSPNGDLFVHEEVISDNVSNGHSYQSFGPGIIHWFDSESGEHKGSLRLNYYLTLPVYGDFFKSCKDNKVLLKRDGDYCLYEINNNDQSYYGGLSRKEITALMENNLEHDHSFVTLFTLGSKIYRVHTQTSLKFQSVSEIKID